MARPAKKGLEYFRWIRIFLQTKRFGCYAVSLALLETSEAADAQA